MNNFKYAQPTSVSEALGLLSSKWGETEILAGGTDLVTSLKQGLVEPKLLVSLKNVEGMSEISERSDSLVIGAGTKLKDLVSNKKVTKNFPALVTAATNIGSAQMLSQGSVGGELLQRPRCWYYRNGFGLLGTENGKSLIEGGENRYHAIFGNKGDAKFVSPSSLAPVLIALGASVYIQRGSGDVQSGRLITAAELFKTPGSDSAREFTIAPNEILHSIIIPMTGKKNGLYEVRHRVGLDWPMVTAAVAFDEKGGKISNATVVLGHVAPTPWVASKAASALNGKSRDDAAKAAGEAAASGATPLSQNAYKVQQVKVAVRRAIDAAS